MKDYRKEDYLEVSDGDTCIVSSKNCPLTKNVEEHHIFNGVVCCQIVGQESTHADFTCPGFYKAVFSPNGLKIDCRIHEDI